MTGGNPPTIVAAIAFHLRVREGIGVVPLCHRHQAGVLVKAHLEDCIIINRKYRIIDDEVKPSVC